jgi:hypothetical protein
MKSIKTTIQTLAVLLVAAVVTAACSSDDDDITGRQTTESKVYTMTVHATKGGDASTRALSLDGTTLNATWTEGDKVEVWSSDGTTVKYGTLTAQSSGSSTTLTGEMDFPPTLSTGLSLQLKYLSNDYSKQTGTLDYIANHCDYATARVKVTGISGSEITTTAAKFQNQQAVIKFTLMNSDGAIFNPSTFTVSDGTSTVTLTDIPVAIHVDEDYGVLYVAFPATGSSATITLTAKHGFRTYYYKKTGVTFKNGQYYAIGVKMQQLALSAATTSDYGKVVCAAGHLHDAKTAVPVGCTAVGILGSVTETGHGLILALQDATDQMWTTIDRWNSTTAYANTTLKVLPDDGARGSLTSYTKLGDTTVSNWAVGQKSDYEAIFVNLGSTAEENGTTYDDHVNAYITSVGGTEMLMELYSGYYWCATDDGYPWAKSFDRSGWGSNGGTNSHKVRPVLGF